jgi:hypothetical protein
MSDGEQAGRRGNGVSKSPTGDRFSLRGRRNLRGVLIAATNESKPSTEDAWALLTAFDADTKLRELLIWVEQFAVHDPGVEWPSDKYENPVDAICAALDRVREEAIL